LTPKINATSASLLGFLHRGPMSGWDIAARMDHGLKYFWNVTPSQVYRELKTLAQAGLIAEIDEPGPRDRRAYALTDAGRAVFREWINRPPESALLRIPFLLMVYFSDFVEPEALTRYVRSAQLSAQRRLLEIEGLRPISVDPFKRELLELGMEVEHLLVRWMDRVLDVSARRAALPKPTRGSREAKPARGAKVVTPAGTKPGRPRRRA
jgi:DNA-binding PadR family transcriptional regulator